MDHNRNNETFLTNKDVDLRSKVLLYMTGPLNALLDGGANPGTSKKYIDQLIVFHYSAIRWILGIKMMQVKEDRIKAQQLGNNLAISASNTTLGLTLEK